MAHDYIPKRDAEFRDWSASFSGHINSAPEQFGLTPLLASEYAALNDAFAAALTAAGDRARPAVAAKKTARKAAEKQARALVRIIQAHPQTTNAMRAAISIPVRDVEPSPVHPPPDAPSLSVKLLRDSTVRITVHDPVLGTRGKPKGALGAELYSFVGEAPPDSLDDWRYEGTTGRPRTNITLRRGVFPGAKVWFTACWLNPRFSRGPMAHPDTVHIACPTLMPADLEQRMAA
jgi:hypothetical protein